MEGKQEEYQRILNERGLCTCQASRFSEILPNQNCFMGCQLPIDLEIEAKVKELDEEIKKLFPKEKAFDRIDWTKEVKNQK